MATYVNNLRLKEIATGAESGTWGTSTNTNLELIADAFGSGTEAITTNADTHTTTVADGAADEGRAIYMKYTGALDSNCTISLAPDTINKFWIIENATTDSGSSGPYSILISQGSGANITIGNGKVAAVFTDGAGSGAAVLDAFADLELSSTLTVAGASTLTGAVTMSGDASVGDDLTLVSDAAVLNFGENSDVSLTHVHDTALLLNSTRRIEFYDSSQYIGASSASDLDLSASTDINLDCTTVDINGALDVSGLSTFGGDTSISAAGVLTLEAGGSLTTASGNDLNIVYPDGRSLFFKEAGTTTLTLDNAQGAAFVGSVFVGETANANMTLGLTINQGAADNEIATFKSSDVSQALTSVTEADTYGYASKEDGATGGLRFRGFRATGAAHGGLVLEGFLTDAASTTKSTSGHAVIRLNSLVNSGGSGTGVGSDGNLLSIATDNTVRFIFDAEGSGHADVEWTTFSDSRLKKNVETIPYGLDTVRGLDARIFDRYSGYIDDDGEVVLEDGFRRMIGFIAQEVQLLVPELVKDVDDKSFYSLDVGRFTPILWSAVKELDTTVQDYQARIEALEAALTELQGA